MEFRHLVFVLALARAFPVDKNDSPSARQLVYLQERQYAPNIPQYDYFDQQFVPYNFIGEKQFPRIQPQIILYHGAAPGQPFLLQPGGAPPGNFLYPSQPQPGPNVILRGDPRAPQRPVFVAGYPKPAHIPPIEKDAEEIPTNPAKIPPMPTPAGTPAGRKPEKLETFNEPDEPEYRPKKPASEVDVLDAADRNPFFNIPTTNTLRPGQRFFILNGQNLFSSLNYPFLAPQNPNIVKYATAGQFQSQGQPELQGQPQLQQQPQQSFDQQQQNFGQIQQTFGQPQQQNFVVRNAVTGQIDDITSTNPENVLFSSGSIPLNVKPPRNNDVKSQLRIGETANFGIVPEDNEAVVIEAKYQDENDGGDTEVVSAPESAAEPSIAQAQPGAIALAGPGGTAAAAPRGTAFAGKEGVAVASPQATAVAGPRKEEKPTSGQQESEQQKEKTKTKQQ